VFWVSRKDCIVVSRGASRKLERGLISRKEAKDQRRKGFDKDWCLIKVVNVVSRGVGEIV
jgi:hypothetical protein